MSSSITNGHPQHKTYMLCNVNWYFLREPPQLKRFMQLNYLFLWCKIRWRHWKCGYTQLEAATINHLHAPITALMFGCSNTQIYDPEVRDEGSSQPSDSDRASWCNNNNNNNLVWWHCHRVALYRNLWYKLKSACSVVSMLNQIDVFLTLWRTPGVHWTPGVILSYISQQSIERNNFKFL